MWRDRAGFHCFPRRKVNLRLTNDRRAVGNRRNAQKTRATRSGRACGRRIDLAALNAEPNRFDDVETARPTLAEVLEEKLIRPGYHQATGSRIERRIDVYRKGHDDRLLFVYASATSLHSCGGADGRRDSPSSIV